MRTAVTHLALAQTGRGVGASILWPSLLLAAGTAAAIGLVLGIRAYRNRWSDGGAEVRSDWTLQDLREMHAKGQLTDDEFERLKAIAMASVSDAANSGAASGDSPGREQCG